MLEDEFQDIPSLRNYADSSLVQNLTFKKNPFTLPPESDIFKLSEFQWKKENGMKKKFRHLSLIQRADLQKPPIPTVMTKSTQLAQSGKRILFSDTSRSISSQSHDKIRGTQLRVNDIVNQKRDIYIMQMLIDRKNIEIKKINHTMNLSEKELIEKNKKIDQLQSDYKIMNAQNEARLAKARKNMEKATRLKVYTQKQYNSLRNSVNHWLSEVAKNMNLLDTYRRYDEFLKDMTPRGYETFEYFKNPQVLIDDFATLEEANRSLFQDIQYYENIVKRDEEKFATKCGKVDESITMMKNQISKIPTVTPFPNPSESHYKEFDDKTKELDYFSNIIRNTYIKCLNKEDNVTSKVMINRINDRFEEFYRQISSMDHTIVMAQLIEKDKKRCEELKLKQQAAKEAETKIKMEIALQRANRPVKKRNGRLLYPKVPIIKNENKNDMRLLRLMKERQRMNEFLYGPVFDKEI